MSWNMLFNVLPHPADVWRSYNLSSKTWHFLTESENETHSVVSDSLWPHRVYSPWNFPGQNSGVGSLLLLQRIFPTQGLNPGLPPCGQILYQLSHKENPRILEWVAYPFSNGSARPRNQTIISCIARGFFTNWAIREAQIIENALQLGHLVICLYE